MADAAPKLYRKSCRRENVAGHAHFLTFSCFHRQPFLSRDRSRQWLVTAIELAGQAHSFDLWAYVIMPEHVHLVLFPRLEDYDIGRILSTIKQSVAKRAIAHVQRHAPTFVERMRDVRMDGTSSLRFWQPGGGYDRNLYSEAEVWEKIEYVHRNPVERGLVESTEEWKWSSAADFAGIRQGPLRLNWEFLPR